MLVLGLGQKAEEIKIVDGGLIEIFNRDMKAFGTALLQDQIKLRQSDDVGYITVPLTAPVVGSWQKPL